MSDGHSHADCDPIDQVGATAVTSKNPVRQQADKMLQQQDAMGRQRPAGPVHRSEQRRHYAARVEPARVEGNRIGVLRRLVGRPGTPAHRSVR
jgi:hypothetical protein